MLVCYLVVVSRVNEINLIAFTLEHERLPQWYAEGGQSFGYFLVLGRQRDVQDLPHAA